MNVQNYYSEDYEMNFEEWHKENNPGYSKSGPLWPVGEEAFLAGFKAGLEARQTAADSPAFNSCRTNDQGLNKCTQTTQDVTKINPSIIPPF